MLADAHAVTQVGTNAHGRRDKKIKNTTRLMAGSVPSRTHTLMPVYYCLTLENIACTTHDELGETCLSIYRCIHTHTFSSEGAQTNLAAVTRVEWGSPKRGETLGRSTHRKMLTLYLLLI